MSGDRASFLERLKRDLGSLESYAVMIGMLVGAGIFKVTGVGSEATGAGVILGYLVLAPAVLATSVSYMVFVSTPLGTRPGGEYAHLNEVAAGKWLAFLVAWLKSIAYLGAMAYLAQALADYVLEFIGSFVEVGPDPPRMAIAFGSLVFFYLVHVTGVRWFGRLQVAMCAVLGVSIAVLVVPGLFAVEAHNYTPLFPNGARGFFAALPPLFFAYAAFEALAHTGAEVKDSTRRLPGIFLRGVLATTLIFVLMSTVAFGVLPYGELAASEAPMAAAAAVYLPPWAAELVTFGGILAVATSLNATLLVPARLALVLADDGLLPRWLGVVHAGRGTPIPAVTASFALGALLLFSGQLGLALNIAVFALVAVYLLNTLALLALPFRNPGLFRAASVPLSLSVQRLAAVLSVLAMVGLLAVLLTQDVAHLRDTSLSQRIHEHSLTALELFVLWSVLGLATFGGMRALGRPGRQAQRTS